MGSAGALGSGGDAKHAVNPSMGARSALARVRTPAHTARPGLGVLPNPPEACLGPMRLTVLRRPRSPTLQTFPAPSFSRGVAGGRKIKFNFKFKSKSRSRCFCFCFCFCFCPCSRLGCDASAPAGNCLGRTDGLRRTAGAMDGAYEPTGTYLRRVLRGPSVLPPPASTRRQSPQPRAFAGFTRFPKKIALISRRSVPCQYLRCAGSSANNTTLPCPCADTSSHALPATRARLRSDR